MILTPAPETVEAKLIVLGAHTAAGGVTVKVGGVHVPQLVTVIGMLSVYEGQPGVGLLTVRLYVVDAVGQTVGVNVLAFVMFVVGDHTKDTGPVIAGSSNVISQPVNVPIPIPNPGALNSNVHTPFGLQPLRPLSDWLGLKVPPVWNPGLNAVPPEGTKQTLL